MHAIGLKTRSRIGKQVFAVVEPEAIGRPCTCVRNDGGEMARWLARERDGLPGVQDDRDAVMRRRPDSKIHAIRDDLRSDPPPALTRHPGSETCKNSTV